MLIFAIGVLCIGLILGFLTGASASPVAGTVITAAFGVLAAALTLHQGRLDTSQVSFPQIEGASATSAGVSAANRKLRTVGLILIVFGAAFAVGFGAGLYARLTFEKPIAQDSLPWPLDKPPATALKAIDWIVLRERLRDRGYSDPHIQSIYEIELGERAASRPVGRADSHAPLVLGTTARRTRPKPNAPGASQQQALRPQDIAASQPTTNVTENVSPGQSLLAPALAASIPQPPRPPRVVAPL